MTSEDPQKYEIQVQINKETAVSTLKKVAPSTVSTALVPDDDSMTPAQVREELLKNAML